MTLVTDKNTMHQYRSATVTEQKASGYSLKMSTWVKISRNYLDDSDQMLQKKSRDYLHGKEKLWLIQYF